MNTKIFNGPVDADITFLLAHGAGAGMDSPFLESIATLVAEQGIRVIRFEFPYMQEARKQGKKRPPNSMIILREAFIKEIAQISTKVVIGGKSMGGRVASMICEESEAIACIALGYPFHPPGRLDSLRVSHLLEIQKPMLIVQGTRDPFGTKEEGLEKYMAQNTRLHWLEDGEHSFVPRKQSGRRWEQNIQETAQEIVRFICTL